VKRAIKRARFIDLIDCWHDDLRYFEKFIFFETLERCFLFLGLVDLDTVYFLIYLIAGRIFIKKNDSAKSSQSLPKTQLSWCHYNASYRLKSEHYKTFLRKATKGELAIAALRLWSQGSLQSPLQNVKKRAFGGIFGAFSNFLYEISHRSFDSSPPLKATISNWINKY
jgi:hypothetical protein